MKCPNLNCESKNTTITHTYKSDHAELSKDLQGLNVCRRFRKCKDCGELFSTIEMLEDDFGMLKKPAGRLSQHISRIRGVR